MQKTRPLPTFDLSSKPHAVGAVVRHALACAVATAVLAPTAALAAEPNATAQHYIGEAFAACDRNDAEGYFQAKDYAVRLDRSLTSWNGKVKAWTVSETIVRCDQRMNVEREKEKRRERAEVEYRRLQEAVGTAQRTADAVANSDRVVHGGQVAAAESSLAEYRKARAAFVAANGGSTSLVVNGQDVAPTIARWDAELPEKVGAAKKADAERKAKADAEAAKEAAARARLEAERAELARQTKATWDALKGDRLAIAKQRGLPDAIALKEIPRARTWHYRQDVEIGSVGLVDDRGRSVSATQTSWCELTFEFQGDKRTRTDKSGPGCKYLK